MNPKRSDAGFTLLEILVAIFIFAIIMTTIFGSFNSVFSNTETLDKDITTYEMAKNAMERMTLDLQSIHVPFPPQYRPPEINDLTDPFRITGEPVLMDNSRFAMLRFAGLAHLPLENNNREGVAQIVFYVQRINDKDFILKRSDELYPYSTFVEKGSDPVLCENIKSLTIVYYDEDGTEYERWNSESQDFKYATPQAIGIILEAGSGKQSIVLETTIAMPVFRKNMD